MAGSPQKRVVAFDGQRGGNRPIIDKSPVFSSAGRDWRGFLFELHKVDQQELHDVQVPHTLIGLHLGQPTRVEVKEGGEFVEKIFQPGDVTLIPAGTTYSIRFSSSAEFIILSLTPELVAQASQTIGHNEPSALPVLWCHRDSFIAETLQSIRNAAEQVGPVDRAHVEALASSVTQYILKNCHNQEKHTAPRGLSRGQLARTIEFIHSTPYREISLKTMSGAAGLSPFHFARMFKLSTGLSPHQFVLKRRLEIGADLLANSQTAIAQIAGDLGFADQSHFTMHFKRLNGIAPAAYRRQNQR